MGLSDGVMFQAEEVAGVMILCPIMYLKTPKVTMADVAWRTGKGGRVNIGDANSDMTL